MFPKFVPNGLRCVEAVWFKFVSAPESTVLPMAEPRGIRNKPQRSVRGENKGPVRMLAAIHHPDSGYGSHERMSQLNSAMDILRRDS